MRSSSEKTTFNSAIFVFLLFSAIGSADTGAAKDCDAYLRLRSAVVPETRFADVRPGKFQSSLRNRLRFWWHRKDIIEVSNVTPRTQCGGTCSLYATQGIIETELKRSQVIGENDYLINLIPVMQLAKSRLTPVDKSPIDLAKLIHGAGYAGFTYATRVKSYYIDAESIAKVGGLDKVETIEYDLMVELSRHSWKWWDRSKKLRQLLTLSEADGANAAREMLEKRLSKKARTPIRLSEIKIREIKFTNYEPVYPSLGWALSGGSTQYYSRQFAASTYNPDVDHQELNTQIRAQNARQSQEPLPEDKYAKVGDFTRLLERTLSIMSAGHAVQLWLRNIFGGADSAHSVHAVTVTGAFVKKKNMLKGFKYVNSWGDDYGANGYGFIRPDEMRGSLERLIAIDSIIVE